MSRQTYPNARRLLADELARLERDHFSDNPRSACDGCRLAARIRAELDALRRLAATGPRGPFEP